MSDCIFCKIANGEIQSPKVYEDENFIVIRDLHPLCKGNLKRWIKNFKECVLLNK